MVRLWMAAALSAFLVLATPMEAPAQTLPEALRSAGVTQAQWDRVRAEALVQAQRARITEAALLAAAEAASVNLAFSGRLDPLALQQTIYDALSEQADQIAELQRRLEALTSDTDASIAVTLARARAALDEGRLADADRALAQVTELDLAAIQRADAEVERLRLRAGQTIASRGQIAFVQADYLAASVRYGRAAETVPEMSRETLEYRWLQAESLRRRGEVFGEVAQLTEALRLLHDEALPRARRETAPRDWAHTQHNLGRVKYSLGSFGHGSDMLQEALVAYRAAQEVFTRDDDPENWAVVQNSLANGLAEFGARGFGDDLGLDAMREAIEAFRAALEINTHDSHPTGWAQIQHNMGSTFLDISDRSYDPSDGNYAVREAIVAHRAALTVFTRDDHPEDWAAAQIGLSNALYSLSFQPDEPNSVNTLEQAVAAARATLEVHTRIATPRAWATAQTALGNALHALGDLGAGPHHGLDALHQAEAAFRAVLEVHTREDLPHAWAAAQYNRGNALRSIGARIGGADGLEALREAGRAYRLALEVRTYDDDPSSWLATGHRLGEVLQFLGERRDGRNQGADALEEALALFRRERDFYSGADSSQASGFLAHVENHISIIVALMNSRTRTDSPIAPSPGPCKVGRDCSSNGGR